jgi:AcrR family transcriptional regulator
VTVTTGRREANKRATRQALQEAADRLFAERGYAATTVRDIAAAAGVTERTFFRYFAGKEELIIDDALSWLPLLQERVRARPAREDALTALRRAVHELAAGLRESPRPTPLWLFSEGPPGARLTRLAPGAILRAENGLADVIRERLEHSGADYGMDSGYLAAILARTTLAVIRSMLIRQWQLRSEGAPRPPSTGTLVNQAFGVLRLPDAAKPGPAVRRRPGGHDAHARHDVA